MTGDGTTTSVLFTGELLRQAERYLSEGLHPRVLTEGFELAKEHALELLDTFRVMRQGKGGRGVYCRVDLVDDHDKSGSVKKKNAKEAL